MIYQERIKAEFASITKPEDESVFMRNEYLYGTRLRANVGFGLWQLACASNAALTADNYTALRQRMLGLRGDQNRLLGVKPAMLVVGPSNEEAARYILNAAVVNATTNPWAGSAELLVSPWLAA